jgi:hypothetical protein
MRAREWTLAAAYGDPADYGVPSLPTWRVERGADGALGFATAEDDGPFITADRPVEVRR